MNEIEIFERVYNSAKKQDLDEMYVPVEMRPVSVSAEEYVNNFFDNFCDENGFVIHDKIKKWLGGSHHNVFAWYSTWQVLRKYPLDKAEVLEYIKNSRKSNRQALFDYVEKFCNKYDETED